MIWDLWHFGVAGILHIRVAKGRALSSIRLPTERVPP